MAWSLRFPTSAACPVSFCSTHMKAVVIEDGRYDDGALVENPEFMRYAYHWNFRIRACRPYRAQTKGKVERPIRYLRESFFYGRTFTSDDDLDAQALHWLETEANVRSHGTLKERPLGLRAFGGLPLDRGHQPPLHRSPQPVAHVPESVPASRIHGRARRASAASPPSSALRNVKAAALGGLGSFLGANGSR